MANAAAFDAWAAGDNYETYMGRWSRLVAPRFVAWLAPPPGLRWLETGCGTGALTAAILDGGAPAQLLSTDPSQGFIDHMRNRLSDPRLETAIADARTQPAEAASQDLAVSGLMLNFVPEPRAALAEARRVLRPGGTLAFYVWDYASGGVGFMDAFWTAAVTLDPAAAALGERNRFPWCSPDGLTALVIDALGLEPEVAPIEIETRFANFEALWHPFTLGTGPAPGYCASLDEAARARLKARLAERFAGAEPIRLTSRAWAVKTRV